MDKGFWSLKFYKDDVQISKEKAEFILRSDKKSSSMWENSKSHNLISWVAVTATIGFGFWYRRTTINVSDGTVPLIGMIGSGIMSASFSSSSTNLKKKAIKHYNKNRDNASFNISPTYNGLGMVVSF